jgi:cell fate regulator YaaT (PSP1 superfamily)
MPATVEVRFKGNRKDYFLWPDQGEPLRLWDPVIVPVERGLDFGTISSTGDPAQQKCNSCSGCSVGEVKVPERTVVRRATPDDIRAANELRRTEEETRRTVIERVRSRGLDMKVSDAEWQWDRKKLTVYFTADQRVDFRDLVRDLAASLHTRIELRQIGARDEAARLGGVGRCGREYCCSSWLTSLGPVSLALAKDQHLSLNPAQISGGCGRLLCCLKYEHEFYVAARKRFPKEGKTVRTTRGTEKVVALDIFRERVFLRSEEQGSRVLTLVELQQERVDDDGPAALRPGGTTVAPGARSAGPTEPEAPRGRATEGPEPANRPAGPPATEPASVEPRQRRRRRRKRRGRPEDGPPPASPNPGDPPAGA